MEICEYATYRLEIGDVTLEEGLEILKWLEQSGLHVSADLHICLWNSELFGMKDHLNRSMTIKTHNRETADKIKEQYPETDWDAYYDKLENDKAAKTVENDVQEDKE